MISTYMCFHNGHIPGPDPGFSVGGRGPILGGFWLPTWALFSENVCENERIGSCRGRVLARHPQIRLCILMCLHNRHVPMIRHTQEHLSVALRYLVFITSLYNIDHGFGAMLFSSKHKTIRPSEDIKIRAMSLVF